MSFADYEKDMRYLLMPVYQFTGREEELQQLGKLVKKHSVVCVHGMAMAGKTELVRKYVVENKYDFFYIFIVKADNADTLLYSMHQLAREMKVTVAEDGVTRKPEDIVKDLYHSFVCGPALLLMENVENETDILRYLPSKYSLGHKQINLIITSRWSSWTRENIGGMRLKLFDEQSSLAALKKSTREVYDRISEGVWKDLAKTVGYHPMSLQQASNHIHRFISHSNASRIAEYIQRLQSGREDLIEKELVEYDRKSIYTSLMQTIEVIAKEPNCTLLLKILNVCAYFDSDNIFREDILRFIGTENAGKLDKALQRLETYSLIECNNTRISIHVITQMFLRKYQIENKVIYEYYSNALNYVLNDIHDEFHRMHGDDRERFKHHQRHSRAIICCADELVTYVIQYSNEHQSTDLLKLLMIHTRTFALKRILNANVENAKLLIAKHELLHEAVLLGHFPIVSLLRKYDADLNQRQKFTCETPLFTACRTATEGIVEYFICAGAEVSLPEMYNRTALHHAARHARFEVLPVLLKLCGWLLNAVDANGYTPLHVVGDINWYIPEEDIMKTVRVLVSAGAITGLKTKNGLTVLYNAARRAHYKLVQFLIRANADHVHLTDDAGCTPLHVAGAASQFINEDAVLKTVQVLLENGADVNERNKRGQTALHCAAGRARCTIVSALLDIGTDLVHAVDKKGRTALHLVGCAHPDIFESDVIETARVLITNGAMLDTKTNDGRTALHYAVRRVRPELVSFILEQNGKFHERHNLNITPFPEYVSFVLEQNKELQFVRDNQDLTPFEHLGKVEEYCAGIDVEEIIHLLSSRTPSIDKQHRHSDSINTTNSENIDAVFKPSLLKKCKVS